MKINHTLLKKLRLQRAMSQEELAIAAGLSARTVQRMEALGTASLESRKAIAAVFGIDAEQLLEKPAQSSLGDPMKVLPSSVLLIAATVLLTFFGIAQTLAPVDSFDSRDLLVGSFALAGLAMAVLAIRELWLLNSQLADTSA